VQPFRPGKLAPLAPLGGSRPLKSSGGGGDDIKEELRRAGLLTLPPGDSYSTQSSVEASGSQHAAPVRLGGTAARSGGGVYDAEYSVSNSNIEDALGATEQVCDCRSSSGTFIFGGDSVSFYFELLY